MRERELKKLMLFTLIGYLFMGCIKQESVASTSQPIETLEQEATKEVIVQTQKEKSPQTTYPIELEEMLSTVPIGSDIYLEEREGGEWYLKIEKTFTSQNIEEESIQQPIYGETILI